MCASNGNLLKTEMRTYVKHELRAICPQKMEDFTSLTDLTQVFLDRVKFLEEKNGYLKEEL